MKTSVKTSIDYFRRRSNQPLVSLGKPALLDWLQVFWHLIPAKEIIDRKNFDPDSVQTIDAHISQRFPLRHISVTVTLFEGVLAQIGVIVATPIDTMPMIEHSILNKVLGQIIKHPTFQSDCDEDAMMHREFVLSQIKRFLVPIEQHLDYYTVLDVQGKTTIKCDVETTVPDDP